MSVNDVCVSVTGVRVKRVVNEKVVVSSPVAPQWAVCAAPDFCASNSSSYRGHQRALEVATGLARDELPCFDARFLTHLATVPGCCRGVL